MIHFLNVSSLIFVFLVVSNLGTAQGIKGKETRRHSFRISQDPTLRGADSAHRSKAGSQGDGFGEIESEKLLLMVGLEPLTSVDSEVAAAIDFATGLDGYLVRYLTFKELKKNPSQLNAASLVWFHRSDSAVYTKEESDPRVRKILREYLDQGGRILLTLEAFSYINVLGIETTIPSVRLKSSVDEGYGRKLGFHSFREHPLFLGLHGGAYIYKPVEDVTVRVNGFFTDTVPIQGKVVAIDWDYIFFREDSKLVVEYQVGKGKLLAVGAYTLFAAPNENRHHLEIFSKNILEYLTGQPKKEPRFYWDYTPPTIVACKDTFNGQHLFFDSIPEPVDWEITTDDLAFPLRPATDAYCEAAGERILLMGREHGGLEEIWNHPFMVLQDYECAIRIIGSMPGNNGEIQPEPVSDTLIWLHLLNPDVEIRPDGFIRHYSIGEDILDEFIVADPVHPCGVIHYAWQGAEKVELVIRFKSNLRLMWLYPESATGAIYHWWDSNHQAMIFHDKTGYMAGMVGGNRMPASHDEQPGEGFLLEAGVSYSLESGEELDIIIAAGQGLDETIAVFERAIRDPGAVLMRSERHIADLLEKMLVVTTPDSNFNAGYRWALLGTDRFFVTTPGMGSALVAGYGTTHRGWDGGQKVSGRPGYAWYFGRDGQWSGFALLDYGDFEKVKKNLEFFLRYQDLNGKIFHEATTSGVVHYDAADATPLFIVLAGNYLLKSGDTAFIQENWVNIKKAIDFCFSTDTDQDHLIENTNVGHGWVEGGELFGSHSSFYLTGCWVAALESASAMAKVCHDITSYTYSQEAKIVKELIDQRFWNPAGLFYSYGINKDGSMRKDATILPAVPAYFGLTDKERMRSLLDAYASNAFSTNWGTRIIGEENPMFKPTGYHYGSVWPLFTGWTALAEYRYGNYIQGFSHIMNNLNGYLYWGKGFVEEVLNGSEYQPSGVCSHQCWSETMVLQPVIEGMVGIEVNVLQNTLTLSPRIPAEWDSLTVENIRAGNQFASFRFTRDSNRLRWVFNQTGETDLKVVFMPALPPGTMIEQVLLNGTEYPFATFTNSRFISLFMSFDLSGEITVEVRYSGGISVLPLISNPSPGSRAEGMRILDATLKGDQYRITLEGLTGTTDTVSVWSYLPIDESIQNASIISRDGLITKLSVEFEGGEKKYLRKTVLCLKAK